MRQKGTGSTQKHEQYQNVLVAAAGLRGLRRAMARVPGGRVLDSQARDGRSWDSHTGMFLRRRGQDGKRQADTLPAVA